MVVSSDGEATSSPELEISEAEIDTNRIVLISWPDFVIGFTLQFDRQPASPAVADCSNDIKRFLSADRRPAPILPVNEMREIPAYRDGVAEACVFTSLSGATLDFCCSL